MLNFTHQILSWNLVWRLIACKRGVLGLKLYTFYKAHCCAKILGYVSCVMISLLQPANEVWGKVIFSEVCVKNSVHGRGIPACLAGHMTNQQGGACSSGLGGCSGGGACSRRGTPGGCLLRGGSAPGVGHAWWLPPTDGYCCGRYTSYWNAFLYQTFMTC